MSKLSNIKGFSFLVMLIAFAANAISDQIKEEKLEKKLDEKVDKAVAKKFSEHEEA